MPVFCCPRRRPDDDRCGRDVNGRSARWKDQQRGRPTVEPGVALRRRQAAQARRRHAAVAVPDRLPDLWHAERCPLQRHPRLPCADRRPACRQHQSGDRQAGLVGSADRSRQDHRHQPLLRHLLQRHRRLHGLDRPGLDQPRHRQALWARPAGHHHPRHGARPADADRPFRHRTAVLRARRLDGRHAGAGMGVELSRARLLGAADRHRRAPFLAEHRLPRGRPPGGHGRPGLARRQIFRARQAPGKGPGGGAHGRPHHLSLGSRPAPEVRPQPAGPRRT